MVNKVRPEQLLCAECAKCGHVWIVARAGMTMADVGRLGKRAACPMCGDPRPLIAKTAKIAELLASGALGAIPKFKAR